ncbi:MAG: tetratricopeptide (TPR) repeat protein [Verrucomicrobiales bacterium]|jgi:tetratricopeptide (TPR) repeat protein
MHEEQTYAQSSGTLWYLHHSKEESVKKIPIAARRQFRKLTNRAIEFMIAGKTAEGASELKEAERIASRDGATPFQVHCLKGSIMFEAGRFLAAEIEWAEAVQIDPDSFAAKCNLAYVFFRQLKWREAHNLYSDLLEKFATTKSQGLPSEVKSVLRLRQIVCAEKAGLKPKEDRHAAPYLNGAEFYLEQAATHFEFGQTDNAKAWIDSAIRIYGEDPLAPLQNVFVEVGWLDYPRTNAISQLSGQTVPDENHAPGRTIKGR